MAQVEDANRRIGELVMENEILRKDRRFSGSLRKIVCVVPA